MRGREWHFYILFRQPFVGVISLDVMPYLKLSESRLSRRPSVVSACGYMRKPTGAPFDPGKATSCAKLYAIQFISQDPKSRTGWRSEEHTSELQSRSDLVCRL